MVQIPGKLVRVHQLVREELRRRLGTQWRVGEWLPSVRELAKVLDTGYVNTHRAVAELTREGYLLPLRGKGVRVLRGAEEAEGVDKSAAPGGTEAAAGGTRATWNVGVGGRPRIVIFRARETDEMVHRMVDAFLETAKPLQGDVRFELLDDPYEVVRLSERVEAAVLFNPSFNANLDAVRAQARHVVAVATSMPTAANWRDGDLVTIDQEEGGFLAGEHLREAGCQAVCFVGRTLARRHYDVTSQARLRGFEAGWGAKLGDAQLLYGRYYGLKTGRHALLRWRTMDPRPEGIFAASDELAMGILGAAIEEGLRPGIDFQLVGFDGQQRGRRDRGFTLTTVEAPAAAMGRQAARLLRQRFCDGETTRMRVVLPCVLHRGQTVRARRGGAEVTGEGRLDAVAADATEQRGNS